MVVPVSVLEIGMRLKFERITDTGILKALVEIWGAVNNDEKVPVKLLEINMREGDLETLKTGDCGYASLEELNFLF